MSPYNYTANNPIKLVDPDGRKIILGGGAANMHVSAKVLMQIAATSQGAIQVNALIANRSSFTIDRGWTQGSNSYDPGKQIISYTSISGLLSLTQVGRTNSAVRMGHELNHAYNLRDVPPFIADRIATANEKALESVAVGFDNYLRDVYGINDQRERYTFKDGSSIGTPTNTNIEKEKIRNFELLNFDATNPYSNDLLSTHHPLEAKYEKKVGNGDYKTYYMRMSINENNEVSYEIFNSLEELNK